LKAFFSELLSSQSHRLAWIEMDGHELDKSMDPSNHTHEMNEEMADLGNNAS
jgi:hypothetical protein